LALGLCRRWATGGKEPTREVVWSNPAVSMVTPGQAILATVAKRSNENGKTQLEIGAAGRRQWPSLAALGSCRQGSRGCDWCPILIPTCPLSFRVALPSLCATARLR